jgi:purine nucleoside permease
MRFRQIAILSRCLCARTVTAALASAFMLGTLCQSQAADPEPKRVLMLQSFGLRFKPWTDFAELLRPEMTKQWGVRCRADRHCFGYR